MLKALSSLKLFFGLCLALAAVFCWQTLLAPAASPYASWWFSALGALLALNVGACAARRARHASAAYLLIHSGVILVLLGALASRAFRFEGDMPLKVGAESSYVYSGNSVYKLPFTVRLENFRIDYYREPRGLLTIADRDMRREIEAVPGLELEHAGVKIRVLRLLRDFALDPKGQAGDKSPYWHNPAAELELDRGGKKARLWFFAEFPGMHREQLPFSLSYSLANAEVKDFTSSVLITPDGGHAFRGEVSVNRPLRVAGYSLYQASYDPADAGYALLKAARDRGLWAAWAGFALLLAGVLLWLRD